MSHVIAMSEIFAVTGCVNFVQVDKHDEKKGRIFGGIRQPVFVGGTFVVFPKLAANEPLFEEKQ